MAIIHYILNTDFQSSIKLNLVKYWWKSHEALDFYSLPLKKGPWKKWSFLASSHFSFQQLRTTKSVSTLCSSSEHSVLSAWNILHPSPQTSAHLTPRLFPGGQESHLPPSRGPASGRAPSMLPRAALFMDASMN